MEFVSIGKFFDIEFRIEGLYGSASRVRFVGVLVAVEVVKESKQRCKSRSGFVNEGSWEERHFASV